VRVIGMDGWALKIDTFLGHEMANASHPQTNTYTAVAKLMYIKLPKYL
jgi:hypothetical protein